MASMLKDKITSATTSLTSSSTSKANTDAAGNDKRSAYRLRITAGPSYDKSLQQQLTINSHTALTVSPHCSVCVRIKDYSGLPSSSPPTDEAYFSLPAHSKDTFSVAWSLTPHTDIPSSDLVFGLDTGHNPLRKYGMPKTLVNTAFKIVKEFVDPSLSCDAGADEPWVRGPAVAGATTTLNIAGGDHAGGQGEVRFPDPRALEEGATGEEGRNYRQNNGLPDDAGKRRKFLLNEGKRKEFVLKKGWTYNFDFSNGYIDWKEYALKLPGFSVPVLKWIGGGGSGSAAKRSGSKSPPVGSEEEKKRASIESQAAGEGDADRRASVATEGGKESSHKVRFFCKNVVSGEVYFVVMCTLLTGDELERALEEDKQAQGQALVNDKAPGRPQAHGPAQ